MKKYYGMRITTILNAADKLTSDLEYLCSIVEKPDSEFVVSDAIVYSTAVTTVSNHLNFIIEDLATRDLSDDGEYVKLSEEDVLTLNTYTDASEESLERLEKTCGIYLQSN